MDFKSKVFIEDNLKKIGQSFLSQIPLGSAPLGCRSPRPTLLGFIFFAIFGYELHCIPHTEMCWLFLFYSFVVSP